MKQVHEVAHSYCQRIGIVMAKHGTCWPPMDSDPPFDLTSEIDVIDLLLMYPAFVELNLSKEMLYTLTTLIAHAAKQSRSGRVLDQCGGNALYHCVRSMPAQLVGRRIFLMEDALPQAVIYGGEWCGEAIHGWRGIETLTVGEGQAKFGATTVANDDECIRVMARNFNEALALSGSWDPLCEASRPDEFGVLSLNFWNETRHARLVFGTLAGFRPWSARKSSVAVTSF